MTDVFDKLPDEIVATIVDKLNWRDAATTTVLSHRFHDVLRDVFQDRCNKLMHEKNLDLGDNKNIKFLDFVDHILQTHKESKVDSLRIAIVADVKTFIVRSKVVNSFTSWLEFAKAKSVHSLELNLTLTCIHCLNLQFPTIYSWGKLTALSLKSVGLADLKRRTGLVNLESLCLEEAPLHDAVINFPKLKRLEIRDCKKLYRIEIESTPKLIQLEMRGCDYMTLIKINDAPRLQCLMHYNEPRKLPCVDLKFNHVPKLSHIYSTGGYLVSAVPTDTVKLEKLELIIKCRFRLYFPALPLLDTFKLYVVGMKLSCHPLRVFNDILAACPKLHKLTLDYEKFNPSIYDYEFLDLWKNVSHQSSPHYHLKQVEFIGWRQNKNEQEVGCYLKKIAPNLEKISIVAPKTCKSLKFGRK